MIKINLLRDLKPTSQGVAEDTISRTIEFKPGSSADFVQLAIRLVFLAGPCLSLWTHSYITVSKLETERNRLGGEIVIWQGKLLKQKQEFEKYKGYKTDNDNLNELIGSIAGLNKRRQIAIRNLDNLQKLVPARVWFQELNLKDAAINIRGRAVSNDDVSDFIRVLNDSAFYSRVESLKNERLRQKYGEIREFEIICYLQETP